MKTASAELKAHFGEDCMTLAVLWKVTRTDAVVMGFTTHDRDIAYPGDDPSEPEVTYYAATGLTNSAADSNSDLSIDNLEVTGFLDSSAITEEDILRGVYDGAVVEERVVNWSDLSMGDMLIRRGTIGNVKTVNGIFQAELRGLTQKLTTQLGALYGPVCRAQLGSSVSDAGTCRWLCNVDLDLYTQSGEVAASPNAVTITPAAGLIDMSASPPEAAGAGYFDNGLITFTSGELDGRSFEIKTGDASSLTLFLPLPVEPEAGDEFTITPGCNHTVDDCKDKFDNIVNFRGEPFIPGPNVVLNYPDAKSS